MNVAATTPWSLIPAKPGILPGFGLMYRALESGTAVSCAARQPRNRVWATSPAAAKATMAAPRTPERNSSREASQAKATA